MGDAIRLAVSGAEALRPSLAAGLRQARLAATVADHQLPLDACDAVLFLEPRPDEAALVQRCLDAGKHVLLTPRPWLSGDALERLATAAQQAGVQLAVLNADRFLPSRQLIRQQLDGGRLGAPGLIRLHRWRAAEPQDDNEGDGERGQLPMPLPVTQDLDLALWLMGSAPNLVYALERRDEPGGQGDGDAPGGLAQLHLGFPGGGMALIDYADLLPPGDGYQSLSLIGASGATYADDHQNVQLVYRGGHPGALVADESGGQILALAQAFVLALSEGDDLSWSVSAWRAAIAVARAARQSIGTHQAIAVEIK